MSASPAYPMPEQGIDQLRVVDGLTLPSEYRRILRPGELMQARDGGGRRLPRWFFEVPGWETALETRMSPHFRTWEVMDVDVREHALLRSEGPRYLPLAAGLLVNALEVLRAEVGTYIHVAANGAYRSPAHRLVQHATPHCWGTAANLYRIGDDWLDNESNITRYSNLIRALTPTLWVQPFGSGPGETDSYLHVDLGYTVVVPHGADDD